MDASSFESYSLDCFEFGPELGVCWSLDNHILILGKQSVLLVTLNGPPFPGSSIKRAKWNANALILSAKFSNVKIEGYHRLAILDVTGKVTIYCPRLDPSLNAWSVICTMDADTQCFDWHNEQVVYGRKDGKIVKADTTIHSRANRIPVSIKVSADVMMIAWDDGLVEKVDMSRSPFKVSVLNDDGCWGVGPFVSPDLFAKVNRVYSSDNRSWELPVLSPVVGLSSDHAITRDGQMYDIRSHTQLTLPVRLERVFGAVEAPKDGLIALTGISKGQPVLLVMRKL